MIIDGKKMAGDIKNSLKIEIESLRKKLRLAIVLVGGDDISKKFIERKKKFGEAIGVDVRVYNFPKDISTTELRKKISDIARIKQNDGVVIQLPLPKHINIQYILDSITLKKDVDMLSSRALGELASGKFKILPPVVGAVHEIFERHDVDIKGKNIVVFGAGRLVGKPLLMWLINVGATVAVVDEFTKNPDYYSKNADIIITGVGKSNLIRADMVKEGVIVIDAGTSIEVFPQGVSLKAGQGEVRPQIKGDVDFDNVSKKASLITPVPGGVGPLTVAILFSNLIVLNK